MTDDEATKSTYRTGVEAPTVLTRRCLGVEQRV